MPSLQLNTGQANFSYSAGVSDRNQHFFPVQQQPPDDQQPFSSSCRPPLARCFALRSSRNCSPASASGPICAILRIASNNKKISDIAFKDQVIATVTQIENIYWDLVSAYEQTQVNEQSSAFAQQTLDNARKQLQLESIPEMDVMRAEAEVSRRDQDLTVARTSLQLQETLMKNAVTKSLDDPVLEAMPVIPTDRMQADQPQARFADSGLDCSSLAAAVRNWLRSDVDLVNRQISRQRARNALLPSLSLVASTEASGLAGH